MKVYTVYKICCLDDSVGDIYVGSTNSFGKRVNDHGYACNQIKNSHHNFKLYQTIRANGGLDNWEIIPIETHENISKKDARIREEYWRRELCATLNMRKSYRSKEDLNAYRCMKQKEYNKLKKQLKEKQDNVIIHDGLTL